MYRRTLVVLAMIVFVTLPLDDARAFSEPFEQGRFEAALAEGRPVLVEIAASWCPVCRAQQEVLSELFEEPRFTEFTALQVDFDTQKDVVRALGAQLQSTLIVYVDGVEVARGVGDTSPTAIAGLLEAAL